MKISDQVKSLHKGQIIDMADSNDDLNITLEIQFGHHAFDTNFSLIPIESIHECIQQAIDDEELVL